MPSRFGAASQDQSVITRILESRVRLEVRCRNVGFVTCVLKEVKNSSL